MSSRSELTVIASAAQLLSLVLFVGALYFARDVFIPLALAMLLSFLLSPLVTRLQRMGVSNTLAVVATACLAFCLISGGLVLLGKELTVLVSELPQYKEELVAKARNVAGLRSGMGDSLGTLAEEVTQAMEPGEDTPVTPDAASGDAATGDAAQENLNADDVTTAPLDENATALPPNQSVEEEGEEQEQSLISSWTHRLLTRVEADRDEKENDGRTQKTPLYVMQVPEQISFLTWATTAGAVLGPLGTAGMVTVFVLFILIYRDDLRDRIISVISHGNYVLTTEALTEVARRISRYLIAQSIVNVTYGVVLSIGLLVIGRILSPDGTYPNVGLWGVLATCFRFVPYVGPIVGAVFPLSMALIIFPGYSVFASVLGLIILMELLSNNIMEPWLYGSSTGISAIAVIVAAVFWGWLWGPVGLLLSTPLTVCLVVLGKNVPRFRILDTLLGEKVAIKPSLRFYQRLLAGDEHQATQIIVQHRQAEGSVITADEVILPTIKRLRSDRLNGELNAASSVELLELLERVVMQVEWPPEQQTAPKGVPSELLEPGREPPRLRCVGIPTHHCSDDIFLKLMRESLADVADLQVTDDSELPRDVARRIAVDKPVLVVITNVPPGGLSQARSMCRTIREHGYEGTVVVACIGNFKHFDRLVVRFRKSGATFMTTTFKQTHFKIRSLVSRAAEQAAIQPALSEVVSGSVDH